MLLSFGPVDCVDIHLTFLLVFSHLRLTKQLNVVERRGGAEHLSLLAFYADV